MSERKHPIPPRRLPVGAEIAPGGVHFRVWAPRCEKVEVVFEEDTGIGTNVAASSPSQDPHHPGPLLP
ncbi:MAG TPA: hypothetical protein VIJ61_12755, partial [Thermoanaerobaculia bacterium]